MHHTPIVSVCVITYNSSLYVIEALESIKRQTYKDIELIVSDDCSKDGTVEVCRKWLNENAERFLNVKIVTSDINTGIGKNANRALYQSKGEWIKLIAGDDALVETCIEEYVNEVEQHPDYFFFHSLCNRYKEEFVERNMLPAIKNYPIKIYRDCDIYSQYLQYRSFLLTCGIFACTCFINANILKKIGGYEELVPTCEDWPTWIKVSEQGYKFYFVDKSLVKYRVNQKSVYSGSANERVFHKFYEVEKEVYKLYIKARAPFSIRAYWNYYFFIRDMLTFLGMTKNNLLNRFIFKSLNKIATLWRDHLQMAGN